MAISMIYIGIDPGIHGAIGVIYPSGLVSVFDMPIESAARGKSTKARNRVAAVVLADIIRASVDVKAPVVAAVENVTARPTDGTVGAFSFGRCLGVVEGILGAFKIPIMYVSPVKWRNDLGIAKGIKAGDKGPSVTRATELYPDLAGEWKAKCHADRAEALLIARWRSLQP